MKMIDYTIRCFVPGLGIGARWLKEQLDAYGVKIRLTDGCIEELAHDAQAAAWKQVCSPESGPATYLSCLREQLARRAEFIHRWTASDDKIDTMDETNKALVRIARKYALPRPWKLTEPVACEWRRPQQNWRWPFSSASAAGPS